MRLTAISAVYPFAVSNVSSQVRKPIAPDENLISSSTDHDPVKPALGYRFDYKGRSIVISGDTSYSENLIKHSQDADVLFHEAQANHQLAIMKKALADNKRWEPGRFFLIFHLPTVLFLSVLSGFTIGNLSSKVAVTVFEPSIITSNGFS